MPKQLMTAALLAALIGVPGLNLQAAPPKAKEAAPAAQGVKWQTDLQSARRQALAEGKPILIVFGAEWCGYCKKLERQTLNTPQMAEYINQNFVAVHLDLDKEKKVGDILDVRALPCSIILSPNAELLGRINGYHTPAPYQAQLSSARQQFQPVQALAPTGTPR
jgi:thioredoxin-like negative regulator of GroEL